MSIRLFASALGLVLMVGPAAAQALPGSFYVGGVAGIQLFSDNENGDINIDFDTGFVIGSLLGFRFGNVRTEAELLVCLQHKIPASTAPNLAAYRQSWQ